ncbi:MAG: hypothetical protein QXN55_09160 [Candidatus Nitrosotenuis sp.]
MSLAVLQGVAMDLKQIFEAVVSWLRDVVSSFGSQVLKKLPETIGVILATALITVISYLIQRKNKK